MPVQCINADRVYETTVTTGLGDYTLAGAPVGFQPVSVIGANNYGMFHITDDVNWEVVIGTYITGPSRLQRTSVLASSNGGALVNWGAGTKKIRCGLPAGFSLPKLLSKSVAGGAGDTTLTAAEQRGHTLVFTGALTGNRNVIVDETVWVWNVFNNTSGAFTLTMKTAAGGSVTIPQGRRAVVYCDGTDVKAVLVPATQAEQEAASSSDAVVTPAVQKYHPGSAKAWAYVTVSGGTPTLAANYNVTSITDNNVGQFTVNFTTAFSSVNYAVAGFSRSATGDGRALCCAGSAETQAAGSCGVAMSNSTSAAYADHASFSVTFFGDQ
jgi:hypothetical protein